ncbi:MAG: HAD family phosphatase [Myxococcota bacterium]
MSEPTLIFTSQKQSASEPTLIFGLGGVLVDSQMIANTVFSEHLARIGVPMTPEQATERFRGRRLDDCVQLVKSYHGVDLSDDFLDALQSETLARLRTDLQPIPHIEGALTSLPNRRCLASSSSPAQIDLSLTVTGLDRFFPAEQRFSADQVEWGKPDPALFRLAATQMGVRDTNCIVIEDSSAGARAARQAGMPVLGFAPGGHNQDPLVAAGAIVFSDMRSLPTMVQAVWANVVAVKGDRVSCFKV